MCGAAKAVGDAFSSPGRAAATMMTFGTSEIARKVPGVSNVLDLPDRVMGFKGGGGGYTPTTLPQDDPAMVLAQSGGAPLLTNIALGANVDDALAGYFGRSSGADFKAWYASLDPNKQAAIDGIRNQLTQIQSNTQMRDAAVQKIVNDYPNLVQTLGPKVQAAKQAAGEEFDAASKGYLDYALKAVAAKGGGSGTVSSGATLQAGADAAAKLGLQKLSYQSSEGDKAFTNGSNDLLGDWQARYTEANALRSFQQKMLGQGATEGFSAAKDALNRNQVAGTFNANASNEVEAAKKKSSDALLGSVGQFAGTAGLLAMFGPGAAAAKSAITPPASSPVVSSNDASVGYKG